LVTQFDKDDAEDVGLVKFDFLGLRTLTIIDNALREVNRQRSEPLDLLHLPLDDQATYQLLQQAQTTAVFQLESGGMKRLIERLQPNNFEDIIALVALYRPGPLQSGMVDDFIDRKHGRKPLAWPHEDYQLDSLRPILEPTYGVILYQEQVMQIAQVMAGFSLGTADILRRAMGKKKPEEMAKQRHVFLEGCMANAIDADLAGNIFDLVEKFAGYGFNKSHSAAYALLSYQTAWLKTHYPAAFMAAVLSADMDNTDKVVISIEECKSLGLNVLAPDINRSAVRFSAVDDKTVLYGLGAIKGVGEAALQHVLAERDTNGTFADLDDLCRRADAGSVNKRVLDALIRSGAADSLSGAAENAATDGYVWRAALQAHLPVAVQGAEQFHRDAAAGQDDLFGLAPAAESSAVESLAADLSTSQASSSALPDMSPWSERERVQAEKDTLGLYLSGHPIAAHLEELAQFTKGRLRELCELAPAGSSSGGGGWGQPKGTPVIAAGLMLGFRFRDTSRGKMAFVTLDDQSARVEVTVGGDLLQSHGHLLQKDEILVVDGDISPDDFNGGYKIRAKEIHDLAGARGRFVRQLVINLNQEELHDESLLALLNTLTPYKSGPVPVWFHYQNKAAEPRVELLQDLAETHGCGGVEWVY